MLNENHRINPGLENFGGFYNHKYVNQLVSVFEDSYTFLKVETTFYFFGKDCFLMAQVRGVSCLIFLAKY